VMLDNSYGKMAGYTRTWGIAPGRSRLVDDLQQADRAARDLLAVGGA
jgi:hypothetical protein